MPTTGRRVEDALIDLFLSEYDDRSWAGERSYRVSPERHVDGGVELVATRLIDRCVLAIEHTLIEPFVGERSDFHKHFWPLQERLKEDESLRLSGHALYVNAPVGVLPHGANWPGIIDDVVAWLRRESGGFPAEPVTRVCPSSYHPAGSISFQVRLVGLGDPSKAFVIVQRYGELRIGDAVAKAVRSKVPKLARVRADRRLLLLERDQGWVDADVIYAEVDRWRAVLPELSAISEVWIADTASFAPDKRYVSFDKRFDGRSLEQFAFYDGALLDRSKNGMPLPLTSPLT